MTAPQQGIFNEAGPHSTYLEYRVAAGSDAAALRETIAESLGLPRAEGQDRVVAFGDDLWRRLAPETVPGGLRPFTTLGDPGGHHAPATQWDLWYWLQAERQDANFDLARSIHGTLKDLAALELELAGFKYRGDRDLIGFVDGTANPKDQAGREAAALVPGTGGGAFVLTQKWVHDLDGFNALPLVEQEAVVGRTKVEDVELEGEAMPEDSHVSRTDAKEDGVAMKVYRRSAPYGTVREHGLYYVAFACDIRRFEVQLERMYGLTDDGLSDRLIEFSRAVTGAYGFAPGTGDLERTFGTSGA